MSDQYYWSASRSGFFSKEINYNSIPSDAVEITQEQWIALLNGQSQGKHISSDESGNPVLQ